MRKYRVLKRASAVMLSAVLALSPTAASLPAFADESAVEADVDDENAVAEEFEENSDESGEEAADGETKAAEEEDADGTVAEDDGELSEDEASVSEDSEENAGEDADDGSEEKDITENDSGSDTEGTSEEDIQEQEADGDSDGDEESDDDGSSNVDESGPDYVTADELGSEGVVAEESEDGAVSNEALSIDDTASENNSSDENTSDDLSGSSAEDEGEASSETLVGTVTVDAAVVETILEETVTVSSEALNSAIVDSSTTENYTIPSEGGALESGTYVLEEDVALSDVLIVNSGDEVIIDLNGYSLSNEARLKALITVYGDLTIEDNSSGKDGSISGNTYTSTSGIIHIDGGFLNLNGGLITNGTEYSEYGCGISVTNQGSFIIEDGTISNTNNGRGVMVEDDSSFIMNGGSISGNTLSYGVGGAGVYINGSEFIMNDGIISGNTLTGVSQLGAGIGVQFDSTFIMNGGYITENSISGSGAGAGVSINDSTFTINGGYISNNETSGSGGGIYMSGGSFIMNSGTISDNVAGSGGGIYVGGVSEFEIQDGIITGNTADGNAGGILVNDSVSNSDIKYIIKDTQIYGNNASYGGGIYFYVPYNASGEFVMEGCIISDNSSVKTGGGVYLTVDKFSIEDSTIINNTAGTDGGGIAIGSSNGELDGEIKNVIIEDNISAENGGGLNIEDSGQVTLNDGVIISGNTADKGGGLYLGSRTELDLNSGCEIIGNSANRGGGVYIGNNYYYPAELSINGSTISNNNAEVYAGGLYSYSYNEINAEGGVIANNTAGTAAADIYFGKGSEAKYAAISKLNSDAVYEADGNIIDGWYSDKSSARYADGNITAVTELSTDSACYLIAAHGDGSGSSGTTTDDGNSDADDDSEEETEDDTVATPTDYTSGDEDVDDGTIATPSDYTDGNEDEEGSASTGDDDTVDDAVAEDDTGSASDNGEQSDTVYTVYFDANSGTVTISELETDSDGRLLVLPTPVRSGYTFNGWYTAKSGGVKVTASYVFAEDMTVYAHWTKQSTGSGSSGSSGRSSSGGNSTSVATIYADGSGNSYMVTNSDGSTTTGSWESAAGGWRFNLDGGAGAVADRWVELSWNGITSWYRFDAAGYMVTGWYTDPDGNTYFLHDAADGTQGYMYTGWKEINGRSYYFEEAKGTEEGKLYRNRVTPDGSKVDETGAKVE